MQTEIPQLAIENTSTHQPKENNEGVIYDVELENTLRDNNGFLKRTNNLNVDGCSIFMEMLRGTEVETNDKEFNITPGIQQVFTDTSYKTAK